MANGKHDNRSVGTFAKPTGYNGIYLQQVGNRLFRYERDGRAWHIFDIESPRFGFFDGWLSQPGHIVGKAKSLNGCLEVARSLCQQGASQ